MLIVVIVYIHTLHIENFATTSPIFSTESIQNITSMYNNNTLTATNIVATKNIDTSGNLSAQNKSFIVDSSGIHFNSFNVDSSGNLTIVGNNKFSIDASGNLNLYKNKARYIRVGNKNSPIAVDYWTLQEFQAYDNTFNNVALNKPVTITTGTPMDNTVPASNITNGNIFNNNPNPQLNVNQTDNWQKGYHGGTGFNELEIDLGSEIYLSQFVLYARWQGNFTQRLNGTTIELLDNNRVRTNIIFTGLWLNSLCRTFII